MMKTEAVAKLISQLDNQSLFEINRQLFEGLSRVDLVRLLTLPELDYLKVRLFVLQMEKADLEELTRASDWFQKLSDLRKEAQGDLDAWRAEQLPESEFLQRLDYYTNQEEYYLAKIKRIQEEYTVETYTQICKIEFELQDLRGKIYRLEESEKRRKELQNEITEN